MAYMNQEKKAVIAKALKDVVPKDWKFSLRVVNHSKLTMTVSAAPVDVMAKVDWFGGVAQAEYHANEYHYNRNIICEEFREVVGKIIGCLNTGNHNNSDIQADHFDVGHYIDLRFGAWNKPFVNTAAQGD